MGLHRYQFSGVMAKPLNIEKHDLFHGKTFNLNDALYLIQDNSKHPAIKALFDKSFRKNLENLIAKSEAIFEPNEVFGITLQGLTGNVIAAKHGVAPPKVIYDQEQMAKFEHVMTQNIAIIEKLCSEILTQPIHFELEKMNDFEFWC